MSVCLRAYSRSNKLLLIIVSIFINLLFLSDVFAKEIAITIDDPNLQSDPLLTASEREDRIFNTLKKHNLKTVLFVCGKYVDSQNGRDLLKRWNDAGHILANHTYSHTNLNILSLNEFIDDTRHNEELLLPYSNFRKIFRYPAAQEGKTLEKRDGFRMFMQENDYLYGGVTIDQLDDYINERLEKRLKDDPNADITPYKKYYLEHVWQHVQYYDNLSISVLGRSPKHTLLIHFNLLNALFLEDVIQILEKNGWKLIDADKAFEDPVFQMKPDILPAGEGLIWALAKETKRYNVSLRYCYESTVLRYPGEDESYEKVPMDILGL